MTDSGFNGVYRLHPGEKLIVMEPQYTDLEPHSARCDAAMQRVIDDLAAYKRETDAKLADQHTELVSLRTQFRKLFDAVQHVGEPAFVAPVNDWIINE